MAQLFADAARAYLSAGINNTDTTVSIAAGGSLFPVANGTDWFKAVLQDASGIEIVYVTAHTSASTSFTVTRGKEGTTARSFAAGSVFGLRVTAADTAAFAALRDRSTHTGEQAISTVTGLATALNGKENTGTAAAAIAAHEAAGDPHPQYQVDLVSGTNIKTINGQSILGAGNIEIQGGVSSVAYDNRANLRSQSPVNGEMAVIDGLGLFVFATGSDELDDDESCFATATGRWLLQAVHWDVVDAWQLPDDEARDAYDEDEPLRFASKVLTGSATCAITSVAAVASTAFTGAVTGAAVGDRVIATPPAALGNTDADSGRLSYHAWVSAADTVTVRLTNASAAAATTNTAIQTAWPITVIKS